jgi:hypothetical protein
MTDSLQKEGATIGYCTVSSFETGMDGLWLKRVSLVMDLDHFFGLAAFYRTRLKGHS